MKPIRWKSKRPNFWKRHKRLLTVVGAAIVFFTYAVKEVWRDEIKEERDGIGNAITIYDLKMGQVPTKVQFNGEYTLPLKKLIETDNIVNRPPSVEEVSFARDQFTFMSNNAETSYRVHEAIAILAHEASVPANGTNPDDTFEKDEVLLSKRRDKASFDLSIIRFLKPSSSFFNGQLFVVSSTTDFALSVVHQRNVLYDFGVHVRDKAEARRRELTHEFTVINITSYFFFAFGWGLGLAGRLFGGSDLVEEE